MSNNKSQSSNLTTKFNRVEGQFKALRRMLEEDRDCYEVVTQIAAARNALSGIARDLLTEEACLCASSPKKKEDFDKLLKTLFNVS